MVKTVRGRIALPAVAAAALVALLVFGAGLVTETQAKPAVDPVPAGARAGQIPFIGEMSMVPYLSDLVPRGWLPADGRLLVVSQNQALFALLGTTFGGNGLTTFRLPNLKGPTDHVRYIIAVQGVFPTRQ